MKGDFSRNTFRRDKHYSGILMQQGRVQLDADFNEQQAIARHRVQGESADVVGQTGTPRDQPGFTITPDGDDLIIGAGRYYVDGLVCENEYDVPYSEQPDLPRRVASKRPEKGATYIAYLEAWERHITALEDADLAEPALGGPDTTTRTRLVWQVKLLKVAAPGQPLSADTRFPEWEELLAERCPAPKDVGRLAARVQQTPELGDEACMLPPSAGYRGLENQLYRVEVHKGGTRGSARFKWSRDNGTVVSALESPVRGSSEAILAEVGKDDLLSFASETLPEWVEVSDDQIELSDKRSDLLRVENVDPATRKITFAGKLPKLDPKGHPFVRRWDQRVGGASGAETTAEGVRMTDRWQELEDGVEVKFLPGEYRVGDYWLIPARTAIGGYAGGVIWPTEGGKPVAQLPDGAPRHLAKLAVVRFDGSSYQVLGDARPTFPPLTAISAADVAVSGEKCGFGEGPVNAQEAFDILCQRGGSLCTLLLGPGDDLAGAIELLGDNPPNGRLDALIGLRGGTYRLSEPLRIENRGHIRLVGIGPGTRIEAPNSERAIEFVNCTSVHVSSLAVSAGIATHTRSYLSKLSEEAGNEAQPVRVVDGGLTVEDPLTLDITGTARPGGRLSDYLNGASLAAGLVEEVSAPQRAVAAAAGSATIAGTGRRRRGKNKGTIVGQIVGAKPARTTITGGTENLGGALTFEDCPTVAVEDVVASCAGGPLRSASCITVRNGAEQAKPTTASVRDCVLEVGHLQVGALLVNVARSRVTDNQIRPGVRPTDDELLDDIDYRAILRRALLSNVVAVDEDTGGTNVTITYGKYKVRAATHPHLARSTKAANQWDRVLEELKPSVSSTAELALELKSFAREMVETKGTGEGGSSKFRSAIKELLDQDPAAASQGVTVGGTLANDVLISGNAITGVHEGVHVGLSGGGERRIAGVVTVRDNLIGLRVGTSAVRDRMAVFVGNSDSVIVEANVTTLDRMPRKRSLRVEGMRVCGTMGRRVIVRHNQMKKGFDVGVTFAPLNNPLPNKPLWIITENDMEGVSDKVHVPAPPPVEVEEPENKGPEIIKPDMGTKEPDITVPDLKLPELLEPDVDLPYFKGIGSWKNQVVVLDPKAVWRKLLGLDGNIA